MSDRYDCPRCGAARSALDPEGLCPRCVFRASFWVGGSSVAHGEPAATTDVSATPVATIGTIPRVWLRDPVCEKAASVDRPSSSEMPARGDAPGRYQFLGEIARGGMGAVLKGRDVELGRDLAVKVLLEAHRDDPDLVRRFIEEAQIAGQLQHPGVVPVYELGSFADRRPYFAMKLVKGRTLADLLAERGEVSNELPRFLAIFEAVCQTMAYAHARGVIHRDLKPSNVMVGAFGEVQVMDWGLARVLPGGGITDGAELGREPEEGGIRTLRSGSDADVSRVGSVIGTPAYMAPEQARGEREIVDERADVFGLGSILCAILTGRPAFFGSSNAESLRKAKGADLGDALARLDACGADPELIVLARDCLAAEPEARPRDAQEVATRMTAHQAGVQERLRRAELARAEAQARAGEERRRRRAEVGLAVAGLMLVVLGGGGWLAIDRVERGRRQRTSAEVQAALDDANRLEGEARGRSDLVRWHEAVSAAERAEGVLRAGGSDAAMRSRVTATVAWLRAGRREAQERAESEARDGKMLEDLEEGRRRTAVIQGDFDPAGRASAYLAAFRAYGVDITTLPESEAMTRLKALAGRMRQPIAATLDDWSWRSDRTLGDRLTRLADAIDPDPTRSAVRTTLARRDVEVLKALAHFDEAGALPPATLVKLGASLFEVGAVEEAESVLRRGQHRYPGDFWINYELAHVLFNAKQMESIRYAMAALTLRPDCPAVYCYLGTVLVQSGRFDEGIAEMDRALALDRDYWWAHINRGDAFRGKERYVEATAAYRRAIDLKPDSALVHCRISSVLAVAGRIDEAIAEIRRTIELEPDHVDAHYNLGMALYTKGREDEAIAAYRRTLELRPDYAKALCNLAGVLVERGRAKEALPLIERGHAIGSREPDWKFPSADWLRETGRMAALEGRLAAILKGEDRPVNADEQADFALLTYRKKDYAASARLWLVAFAEAPGLAEDVRAGRRYHAACAASRFGCGRAQDDPKSDDASRARWRSQAREWLDADLAAWRKLLADGTPQARKELSQTLSRWQADPDLAGLRDEGALIHRSEAERQACRKLWAGVQSLMANVAAR